MRNVSHTTDNHAMRMSARSARGRTAEMATMVQSVRDGEGERCVLRVYGAGHADGTREVCACAFGCLARARAT